MGVISREQHLHEVFAQIDTALQTVDACVARYPADSPEAADAIAAFEQAWQRFRTDWAALLDGTPSAAPPSLPLTLLQRLGLHI